MPIPNRTYLDSCQQHAEEGKAEAKRGEGVVAESDHTDANTHGTDRSVS